MKIILASSSIQRSSILKQLGIPFSVKVSKFQENNSSDASSMDSVKSLVTSNAFGKAREVEKNIQEGIIIGADSLVWFDNKIFSKPKTERDALETLRVLNGKKHYVVTGICIIKKTKQSVRHFSACAVIEVYFRKCLEKELVEYVNTGEPIGKAGAYGIEGRGARFIKKINGDYYAEVGLPVYLLFKGFEKLDISI